MKTKVEDTSSIAEASREAFKTGWREVSSDKYQVIAAACPQCAKLAKRKL